MFDQISNRVRGIFVPPAPPIKPKATLPTANGSGLSKNLEKNPRKAKRVSNNSKPDGRTDPAGNSALLVLDTGEWEVVRIKEAKQWGGKHISGKSATKTNQLTVRQIIELLFSVFPDTPSRTDNGRTQYEQQWRPSRIMVLIGTPKP